MCITTVTQNLKKKNLIFFQIITFIKKKNIIRSYKCYMETHRETDRLFTCSLIFGQLND